MATLRASGFFVSGGTMPLDSESYVERSSDVALHAALTEGRYCYVLNSRQMGKSSLSVREMSKLDRAGIHTVLIDLTRIGGRNVTAVQWYAGLCDEIGSALELRAEMLAFFRQNSALSPMQRFFGAIRSVILEELHGPVVIFIDEVDATKNLNFDVDEFFAGIRECHNRRVQDPAYNRLTFCLIGVAVPVDLIRNPSTTPFNIGERIQLHDFTIEETLKFAGPLGPNGPELVGRVHYWTNGQPFLTQSLCEAIARDQHIQSPADVDALVSAQWFEPKARTTNINLADVGNRALNAGSFEADPEKFRADLLTAYERAWKGGSLPDDETNRVAVRLKLSGLMRSDGRRLLVRNRIYHHVFDRTWVRENMPDRELVRERQAFRRGIFRAAAASALVVGLVSAFGVLAWRSRQAEVKAREALDYELYVADMNNMRLLEETGDVARMEELLNRTKDSPHRGFEWGFNLKRIHDSHEEYTLAYSAPGKREDAVLSLDGTQLCLYDSLLSVACVIDRRTRKPIGIREVSRNASIVASSVGFLVFDWDAFSTQIRLHELLTGREVSSFGDGRHVIHAHAIRSGTDFSIAITDSPNQPGSYDLRLWNMTNGHVLFARTISGQAPVDPVSFDAKGSRVLYGVHPGSDLAGPATEAIVQDVKTGAVIDRFPVPKNFTFLDFSLSGRYLLYQDGPASISCRDIDQHRSLFEGRPLPDANPASAALGLKDRTMSLVYGNGQAIILDLKTGQTLSTLHHVWSLSGSVDAGHLLAAATSIRIFSGVEPGSGTPVCEGSRIGRNGLGAITVVKPGREGLRVMRDPDLKLVEDIPAPQDMHNTYTYNGRWVVVRNPDRSGWLYDTSRTVSPLKLAETPVNFSCGIDPDSIVIIPRGGERVEGVARKGPNPKWVYPMPGRGVNGIWVSPDGKNVILTIGQTDFSVLDAQTGVLRAKLGGHNVKVTNVAFTFDSKGLFTCGADGRVILWDLRTLKRKAEFRGNVAQRMASADLSPDGRRIVTGNFAGAWQLWDAETGVELMEVQASSQPLRSVVFTSDGRNLLTTGDDQMVRQWGMLDSDPSVRIPVPQTLLNGIAR